MTIAMCVWVVITAFLMLFAVLCHATAMWLHEETWRLIFGLPPRPQPFFVRVWRWAFDRRKEKVN